MYIKVCLLFVTMYSYKGLTPLLFTICLVAVKSHFVDDYSKVPSPPLNLTIWDTKDKQVSLSWRRPEHPNGDIYGYRVYFMRENYTSARTVYGQHDVINYTLYDIQPLSTYMIWTKAFTLNHEGNSSDPVNVTTDFSGPGAPYISNLTCQSETTLYLKWYRPGQVYGEVDLYYIYYRPEDSFQFEEITVNSVNNRLEHNFLISNLSANTMYEVKVRGGTYSRYHDINNFTYKGPSSNPRKIQLYPDCHSTPHSSSFFNPNTPWGSIELHTGVLAGAVCALFILSVLVIAIII